MEITKHDIIARIWWANVRAYKLSQLCDIMSSLLWENFIQLSFTYSTVQDVDRKLNRGREEGDKARMS